MRVYKDSKTGIFHADFVRNGRRVRPSLHTTKRSVALLKVGQVFHPADTYPQCPIENFEARFFAYITPLHAPNTVYRNRLALKKLKEFHAVRCLDDITPALLADFQVHLLRIKPKGNNGINRILSALKSMMRQAERWELIRPQVWQNVPKLKVPKGRIEYHSPKEISQILAHCPSDEWKTVVLLGCRAGLRKGEIARLKWKDVDFEHQQIYVAPHKTEKYRYVPLSQDLAKWLKTFQNGAKNEFLINIGITSQREEKDYLSAAYRKNMKDLPFNCFLHKLRHTFASHLVQAGVDLYRVSKLLGHSSIKMTEIYAHLAPADLHEAINHLPDLGAKK